MPRILINIQATKEEREAIQKAAEEYDMTVAGFTRLAWVQRHPKLKKVFYGRPR